MTNRLSLILICTVDVIDLLPQLLVCEFLDLLVEQVVVDFVEVKCMWLQSLSHEVAEFQQCVALGVLQGLDNDVFELLDVLGEDGPHQLFGTHGPVAYLLNPGFLALEAGVIQQAVFHIALHLLNQVFQEHLHDVEVVLQVLHYLGLQGRVHEGLELVLREQSAFKELSIPESDEGPEDDGTLILGQDKEDPLGSLQVGLQHPGVETLVQLDRDMVDEDGLVSLEQEPVHNILDDGFGPLLFIVLLDDTLVHVLLLFLLHDGVVGLVFSDVLYLLLLALVQLHVVDHFVLVEVHLVSLVGADYAVLGKLFDQLDTLAQSRSKVWLFGVEHLRLVDLFPGDSVFLVVLDHLLDHLFKLLVVQGDGELGFLLPVDVGHEVVETSGYVGRLPEQQLEQDNAQRPDIAFGRVRHPVQDLWTHVEWTPDRGIVHSLLLVPIGDLREPEVGYLVNIILDQDVCRLHISMHYAFGHQELVSIDHLSPDLQNFLLRETGFLLESALKRVVAELKEQVDVVSRLPHVKQFDYVLVGQFFHNLDLVLQGGEQLFRILLQLLAGNLLDCNQVIGSNVSPLPDYPVRAFPELFLHADDVRVNILVVGTAHLLSLLLDSILLVLLLALHIRFKLKLIQGRLLQIGQSNVSGRFLSKGTTLRKVGSRAVAHSGPIWIQFLITVFRQVQVRQPLLLFTIMGERKAWTKEEDEALRQIIEVRKIKKWSNISQTMEKEFGIYGRTGKQCRERWHNQLDPSIKVSEWSLEEERTLFQYHNRFGNKWAKISHQLDGRTDNCVKNHFYSTLRRSFRRLNRFVFDSSRHRKGLKELKPVMLSKLVAAAQDKFDNKLRLPVETVNKSIELKNRLIPFARQGEGSNEDEQEMELLVKDLLQFGKSYKRKKTKKCKKSQNEEGESDAEDAESSQKEHNFIQHIPETKNMAVLTSLPEQPYRNLFSFTNNQLAKEQKESKESTGAFELINRRQSKLIEQDSPNQMFKRGSSMSNWSAHLGRLPSINERGLDLSFSNRISMNLLEASYNIDNKNLFAVDFQNLDD